MRGGVLAPPKAVTLHVACLSLTSNVCSSVRSRLVPCLEEKADETNRRSTELTVRCCSIQSHERLLALPAGTPGLARRRPQLGENSVLLESPCRHSGSLPQFAGFRHRTVSAFGSRRLSVVTGSRANPFPSYGSLTVKRRGCHLLGLIRSVFAWELTSRVRGEGPFVPMATAVPHLHPSSSSDLAFLSLTGSVTRPHESGLRLAPTKDAAEGTACHC